MAFRQSKSGAHRSRRAWESWFTSHRATLVTLGLPPVVYLDSDHWQDFLENGHLHWHDDPSHFEFATLSPGEMEATLRFLEQEYGAEECTPPLLRWLRVRCGNAG